MYCMYVHMDMSSCMYMCKCMYLYSILYVQYMGMHKGSTQIMVKMQANIYIYI